MTTLNEIKQEVSEIPLHGSKVLFYKSYYPANADLKYLVLTALRIHKRSFLLTYEYPTHPELNQGSISLSLSELPEYLLGLLGNWTRLDKLPMLEETTSTQDV